MIAVEPEGLLRHRYGTGSLDTIITWTLTPEGEGTRSTLADR